MQYFIPIIKSKHHLWQTELLLQSLKGLNLFDDAVVSIVDKSIKVHAACPNIENSRKFLLSDHGDLNVLVSLYMARKQGFIKPPYTILHPDMVMVRPVESNSAIALDMCGRGIPTEYHEVLKSLLPKGAVVPTGGMICINEEPANFMEQLEFWTKKMMGIKPHKLGVRAAFAAAVWESYYGRSISVEKMSSEMPEETTTFGVHYFRGLPPYFHKNMFGEEVCLSGSPLDALLESNPTANSEMIQRVVREYRRKESRSPKPMSLPPIGMLIE